MASWGNEQGLPYPQDMDSNGQKLVVRNAGETPSGQYRVEILDPTGTQQALQVKGMTWLESVNNDHPEQAFALAVKGRTTMGSWDTTHRPQPVLLAGGRTELQAYADQAGQDPEYALKVRNTTVN